MAGWSAECRGRGRGRGVGIGVGVGVLVESSASHNAVVEVNDEACRYPRPDLIGFFSGQCGSCRGGVPKHAECTLTRCRCSDLPAPRDQTFIN